MIKIRSSVFLYFHACKEHELIKIDHILKDQSKDLEEERFHLTKQVEKNVLSELLKRAAIRKTLRGLLHVHVVVGVMQAECCYLLGLSLEHGAHGLWARFWA